MADATDAPDVRPDWHALAPHEALRRLDSRSDGLDPGEAARRLEAVGPNVIPRGRVEGPLKVLFRQFTSPIVLLLIASTVVAMLLGKFVDGLVVLAAVVINAIVGFIQEYRAGKAVEALSRMVPHDTTVLRGGGQSTVPSSELVPGDVVALASGDRVPADARLLVVRNLRVDEAALTGESVPVGKGAEAAPGDAVLGDRRSMAYGGTLVTSGHAKAVIVETGARTELGRISAMIEQATDLDTPLTQALDKVGKWLTVAVLVVAGALMGISLLRGYPMADAVLVAITLAVAAIPEGLPAVITIALAIGVQRMARRHAIVRKLPSVETLGSTTVICSDKTGTLTRNEMTVKALWTPGGGYTLSGVGYEPEGALAASEGEALQAPPEDALTLARAAALCSDATLVHEEGAWTISGDPTEGALVVAARKLGLDVERARGEWMRLDAIPFESEHQYMATLNRDPAGGARVLVKGAFEAVLARCDIAEAQAAEVHGAMERMAKSGLRVLAIASAPAREGATTLEPDDVEGGLTLLGLAGMMDPPRPEAIAAVQACHEAGIAVKMITGDHPSTAAAIGAELGLTTGRHGAVTGREIARASDEELRALAADSDVFARVAPEDKLRLVRILQADGHVVAMTGDGVNDAPALKQANIGVAMGITGTAVSKEAADVVLTDDNFATIAAAVVEGRRIYDNLVKSLAFILPTNLGLGLILMVSVLFFPVIELDGQAVPLMPMLPAQMLWVNLIAAVALALPLAFEAPEPNVMNRPPRRPGEPILNRFVVVRTFLVAALMTAAAVAVFQWEYARFADRLGHDLAIAEAQTMAITTVVAFQIFYLLASRSARDPIRAIGWLSNPSIYVGIGVLVVLHLGFIYLPPLQRVFGSAALDPLGLAVCLGLGALILPIITFDKWLRRRAHRDPLGPTTSGAEATPGPPRARHPHPGTA